jgi:glycosyltransferase involved in cell wall biosynthesis
MTDPLVSVIVTTKNNHTTLHQCLSSIQRQTYPHTELLVIDNHSTDDTKDIAKRYTDKVFDMGPERSSQRNFGVLQSHGAYILIIDSDMELDEHVVAACVARIAEKPKIGAVIIPEESFGLGFWAQCKRLERSFYVGQDAIEAARFFDKTLYQQVGGYDEAMTGGEDWDLTRRARQVARIGRIEPFIRHNEGQPRFMRTVRKMYYYSHAATAFFANNSGSTPLSDKSGPLARYKLFFSRPGKLFRNPALGFGMLALKTAEYAAGGLGYYHAKRTLARSSNET